MRHVLCSKETLYLALGTGIDVLTESEVTMRLGAAKIENILGNVANALDCYLQRIQTPISIVRVRKEITAHFGNAKAPAIDRS